MTRLRQATNIIFTIICLGLGLAGVALLLLPGLIETRVLPHLAKEAGLTSLSCRINHVGLTKASAGPLTLGTGATPDVTIEQITLHYNPRTIQHGELKKVILSGVSIKTLFSKGTLTIPDLEETLNLNLQTRNTGTETKKEPHATPNLPIPPFKELTIERSFIIAEVDGNIYRVPFSLKLKKQISPETDDYSLAGTLKISPRNSQVTLRFTATIDEKAKVQLNLQTEKIDLENFADILQRVPGIDLKGQITLRAKTELALNAQALKEFNARIIWHQGHLHYNDFRIRTEQSLKEPKSGKSLDQTCVMTLQKNDPANPWQLKINQLYLDAPFTPTLSDIDISIRDTAKGLSLQGRCESRMNDLRHEPFTLNSDLRKKWDFRASFMPQGDWQADLKSPTDNSLWEIERGEDLTIRASAPGISVNASGNGGITKSVKARLEFAGGNLQAANSGLRVEDITAIIPWHWPPDSSTVKPEGKVDCRKIFWQGLNLGSFATSLEQQGREVLLNGHYDSSLIKGLKMLTTGRCGLNQNGALQAAADFDIAACKAKSPINLEIFSNSANGTTLDGTFSANGIISFDERGVTGSATAVIEEGLFRDDKKNLLISGINCSLHLPKLPSLRSAPSQSLTFNHLKAGNISSQGGTLAFQIESEETLFLEKSRLSWCGGNIETQALRISAPVAHYQSTLYCDRLQLAELLEQLGQVKAQGEGSLNGRIPVTWKDGKITFDDGFLYSTPGQGGTIKITGNQTLTAGLPTSSPEFAQLDLAREALKDYQYEWTKMKLNSKAEELIINLQFDGKPNRPLPFVYKKEIGGFARVSAKSPGSQFQGINLDINLRLPLNHILQY